MTENGPRKRRKKGWNVTTAAAVYGRVKRWQTKKRKQILSLRRFYTYYSSFVLLSLLQHSHFSYPVRRPTRACSWISLLRVFSRLTVPAEYRECLHCTVRCLARTDSCVNNNGVRETDSFLFIFVKITIGIRKIYEGKRNNTRALLIKHWNLEVLFKNPRSFLLHS